MKFQAFISVIIPIYNVEKYLNQCIDSIISQTFRDIEVILVDDGSTDNSPKICDAYARQDDRVKVIHQKNGGPSSARNAGIDIATGKYIMFVDGDDWVELNTIQSCVNSISLDDNVDLICFSYIREYENTSLPVHLFNGDKVFKGKGAQNFYRQLFGPLGVECREPQHVDKLVSCCMKLYRADIIDKGRFFDTKEVGSCEDGLFNMYALYGYDNIVYIDECFYHYRKVRGTLTSSYRPNLIKQWNRLFDIIYRITEEKDLSEDYKIALNNRIAFSIIGIGLNEFSDMQKNFFGHKQVISGYLKSDKYKNSVKGLKIRHLTLQWKIFMFCCKQHMAFAVSLMLKIMLKLKSKV